MNKTLKTTLIKKLKENSYNEKEIKLIEKAISFAKKTFEDEKNNFSIDYNLKIGMTLTKLNFPIEIIIAGILYKIENTNQEKTIEKEFGEEVKNIIHEQKRLKEIKEKSKNVKPEILRQIIITSIKDTRAILVKLASKIYNLKNIKELSEQEQKRIATETIDFYAPLANRLGFENLKKELIDNAFKILNPKKYFEIEKFLQESAEEREETIKKIIKEFETLLKKEIKNLEIKGREKQIYSIYEKIIKRKRPLHKQRDHYAIRIITKTEEECYIALNLIKKNNLEIKNSFKDYIKNPKDNLYQSIHLGLKLKSGKILEVQIRTSEMNENAEEGGAAHWSYKDKKANKKFENKTAWLKEILKLQEEKKNKQFLKELKLNLFNDKIYCFTPTGDAFELNENATLLDFAYKIHAEIGNKAIGGLIDNKFSPLNKTLENGNTVKIITNKFQRPRRSWMKFVTSTYAKKIIARTVKKFENIPVSKKQVIKIRDEEKLDSLIHLPEFPNHTTPLAKCCNPIPGEKIVGIIRSHRKIIIHRKNCKKIENSKKYEIETNWKDTIEHPIKLIAQAKNRSGILADILNTILKLGYKVKEANAKLTGNEEAECFFIITPETTEEIENIIKRIKKIKGILKIWIEN